MGVIEVQQNGGAPAAEPIIGGGQNVIESSGIEPSSAFSDELSRGQIGAKLDIQRKDEFGDLAAAIARMQRSMQIMLKKLKAS